MKHDAAEVLIYQDELEIHRHPALTRMWAPIGQQPEVPSPGKNEKKVVYGGVAYATGKIKVEGSVGVALKMASLIGD